MRRLPLDSPFHYSLPHSCGHLVAQFSSSGLRTLLLLPPEHPLPQMDLHKTPDVLHLAEAIRNYFSGTEESFRSLRLDLDQGTDFQQQVWRESMHTPWGETSSYGALAARLGLASGAARAVGHALGANPLHLVVPCHRYLSGSGELVDFAGGLEWKRFLLQREGSLLL